MEKQIDWLDEKLSDNSIFEIERERERVAGFDYDALRIRLSGELEIAITELNELKDKLSQGDSAKLLELCKENAINTITSQFGLASLVISSKDGGSVTTTHNFKQGITANDEDRKKYEEWENNKEKIWSKKGKGLRKDRGYDNGLDKMKNELFANNDTIDCEYGSGKISRNDTNIDHIVSAHEIEFDPALNLYMTPEQRAKIATNKINLAAVKNSPNQSKGNKKMKDWIKQKRNDDGKTNAEHFGLDEKVALEKDKEARKFVNMEKFKAQVKKDGKELAITGGKDAVKMAVYSVFALILREFIEATIDEIKITLKNFGDESFSEISKRFKTRLGEIWENIKAKWKDILKGSLEGAITAFFSNLLVFAINLVTTTLKKIVSIIRAGFVSLVQAIKMIVNPPENVDKDDVYYEAFKILITGIIGGASLGLSAGIDSLLASVPGLNAIMALPLPFSEHGTVGSALSVTISALLGGLLTTIVLYYMDKFRSNAKQSKLKFQLMAKSGEVVQLSIAQSWFVLGDGYKTLLDSTLHSKQTLETAKERIRQSDEKTSNKIKSNFDEINNALSELENL
ncbi:hypothetical protein OFN95_06630 [Campylobacter sp. VBCF_02 NA5]|uniref:hypothetical protein n=1 Tax=unclassified Campylobacter TaxID=2593542 RepID=UPI0022E9E96F|nr:MULTISPECIES: hypothetical protein [unclassified Campylobacter]MDA3054731.1 hypothetical protein [Campylobacter sp. VBCF_07 NA4]MDA3061236.1 hypothetical protein [Campylobacter sp. VBCF_02 NA5]WBR54187.1 hypothetical protein PF027_07695 [Campylobacter sp. VBCF_01 NA2]